MPPFVKEEMAPLFKKFVVGNFNKALCQAWAALRRPPPRVGGGGVPACEIAFVERAGSGLLVSQRAGIAGTVGWSSGTSEECDG